MGIYKKSPSAMAEEFGERLRQARLNANMTQTSVADLAGVSRKVVLNAEKGKVQLEAMMAIMIALNLTSHLDSFLPIQAISPIQLMKMQGKKRVRASRQKAVNEEKSSW